MPLLFKGKIGGIRPKTYEGKTTITLQFVEEKTDGSLVTYDIKVPDNVSPAQFQKGQETTVPVLISTMNNMLYYRIDADSYNAVGAVKR